MDTSRKSRSRQTPKSSVSKFSIRDQVGNKPWGDKSLTAQLEFWNASSTWLPTWGNGTERGLTVKSVKMYSLGACGASIPPS